MSVRHRKPDGSYDITTHKWCPRCQQAVPRTDFPRSRNAHDGLHGWCSSCNREASDAWSDAHMAFRRRKQAEWARRRRYGGVDPGPRKQSRYLDEATNVQIVNRKNA